MKRFFGMLFAILTLMVTTQCNSAREENWYEKGKALYDKGDYVEAIELFKKGAEQGDAAAQCALGLCYVKGNGTSIDSVEAVKYFRLSEKQGYAKAQYNLGVCYTKGFGVEQNYVEALNWYRKAAEQDYIPALYNIWQCYHVGQGVEQDNEEAIKWLRRIIEQWDKGNSAESQDTKLKPIVATTQYNLGFHYYNGLGVEQDYSEAVKWYRSVVEQGYTPIEFDETLDTIYKKVVASAQSNLGRCYVEGQGVTQDYEAAVKLWRQAAELGDSGAQYNLACCYRYGAGVTKDLSQAIDWFTKAAEQGVANAQKALKELGVSDFNKQVTANK